MRSRQNGRETSLVYFWKGPRRCLVSASQCRLMGQIAHKGLYLTRGGKLSWEVKRHTAAKNWLYAQCLVFNLLKPVNSETVRGWGIGKKAESRGGGKSQDISWFSSDISRHLLTWLSYLCREEWRAHFVWISFVCLRYCDAENFPEKSRGNSFRPGSGSLVTKVANLRRLWREIVNRVHYAFSIYGADAMMSAVSVKSEKRDKADRDRRDHRKKSYFEKPAEVFLAYFCAWNLEYDGVL